MSFLAEAERKISLSKLLRDVRLSSEKFTIGELLSEEPEVRYVTEAEYNRLAANAQAEKEQCYKDGYADGQQMGYGKGRSESHAATAQFNRLIHDVESQRLAIYRESEVELVDLAVAIARKIISSELEGSKEIIIHSVRKAVELLRDRSVLTLKVAPEQESLVRESLDSLYDLDDRIEKIDIVPDRRVGSGGCIVETESGNVDARIETELQNIETALRKANSSEASE